MEKTEKSQAFLRKRKMLLAMPLLIIPFLTMGFWALGGGGGTGDGKEAINQGLNPTLPDARLKEEQPGGKLSFYDQAAKDSVKRTEWMRNDPYYRSGLKSEDPEGWEALAQNEATGSGSLLNPAPYDRDRSSPEGKIMEKLAKLQKGLDAPPPSKESDGERPTAADRKGELTREVDRLEHLMEGMKASSAEDPAMEQLQSVMDKILDIQHPERVRRRLEELPQGAGEAVKELQVESYPTTVSLLLAPQQGKEKTGSGFYSGKEQDAKENVSTAIPAVVHSNQTLTDGAVVKLRLTQDVHIGGTKIPKGSFAYGRATLNKERLLISITSLHHKNSLFPVALEVHDIDGMAGISIPGALGRDVAKESADRSLTGLELSTLDPSLKAKAATAGLSAAKNLLSRKVKQVRVTVKAGYRVLLKDRKREP